MEINFVLYTPLFAAGFPQMGAMPGSGEIEQSRGALFGPANHNIGKVFPIIELHLKKADDLKGIKSKRNIKK